ncbi:hypothetical protein RclHR1_42340001, partial [Rhizophagus clarus]
NCGYLGLKIRNVPQYRKSQLFRNCLFAALSLASDNEEDGYVKVENAWYYTPKKKQLPLNDKLPLESSQPKTYDELFSKLSPAMRKMCQSHTVQKKESISDEWFSSLQYLNAKIDDLTISNSFLDSASEFRGVNNATINALGWKADKPSDFAIKGNYKHITDSLGWFTDVPISIKDKDGKTVTATGNFTRIDNGEPELMLSQVK